MDVHTRDAFASKDPRPGVLRSFGVVVGTLLLLGSGAACGSDVSKPHQNRTIAPRTVPAELKSACGHPGRVAKLVSTRLPMTIAKSRCDLSGVVIEWKDGKDTVPGGEVGDSAAGTVCNGTDGATCPSVAVAKNGDVTIAPSS